MTGPRIDPPQKPVNVPHPYDSSVYDATRTEAQAPQSPDPLPDIPYTSMSKEGWQTYLQEKLLEHRNGTNPKAMLGITKAVHALNSYENQAIAPNEAELLKHEGMGVMKFPEQAIRGTAGLLDDLVEGHFNKANKDIIEGVSQFGAGFGKLPAAALHGAVGDPMPGRDELNSRAEQYGGSTAGLAALTATRAFGPKSTAPGEGLAPELSPVPKDLLHMNEDEFMGEYRKGRMTPKSTLRPDEEDVYGLNDITSKAKPLDDMLKQSTHNVRPLTDQSIEDILKSPSAEDLAEQKEAAKAAKEAKEEQEIRDKIKGTGIGLIPGIGKYAKVGYSMLRNSAPSDMTSVKNSALTKALQASIFRSLTPKDTNDVNK